MKSAKVRSPAFILQNPVIRAVLYPQDIYSYLFFEELNIDPKNPKNRIAIVSSFPKDMLHLVITQLLQNRGYFPVEDLKTLRHIGSYLQGHPDMKHIPGVDMSTGSLGQGVSSAVGMAISAKLSGDDYRVYTLLGDGEIQEGQVWGGSHACSPQKTG